MMSPQNPVLIGTHFIRGNYVIFVDDYFENCRTPRGIYLCALKIMIIMYVDSILITLV